MGGGALLSVLTAVTISGCTLLSMGFLRSLRAYEGDDRRPSSSSLPQRAAPASTGGVKKKAKTVRFSEDVEEPRGSGADYRAHLRLLRRRRSVVVLGDGQRKSRGGADRAGVEPQERRMVELGAGGGEDAAIPANRWVLYRGLCQNRAQVATLMLYPT